MKSVIKAVITVVVLAGIAGAADVRVPGLTTPTVPSSLQPKEIVCRVERCVPVQPNGGDGARYMCEAYAGQSFTLKLGGEPNVRKGTLIDGGSKTSVQYTLGFTDVDFWDAKGDIKGYLPFDGKPGLIYANGLRFEISYVTMTVRCVAHY